MVRGSTRGTIDYPLCGISCCDAFRLGHIDALLELEIQNEDFCGTVRATIRTNHFVGKSIRRRDFWVNSGS
jgi:hypothetical protein